MYIMCIIVAPGNVDVNPTAASPTSEPAALPPERSDRFIFINSVIHLISSAHACPLCSQWKCDPQSENRAFVIHYRNCQYTYIETGDFWCRFCLSKGAKKGKLAFKQTPPPKKHERLHLSIAKWKQSVWVKQMSETQKNLLIMACFFVFRQIRHPHQLNINPK